MLKKFKQSRAAKAIRETMTAEAAEAVDKVNHYAGQQRACRGQQKAHVLPENVC